MNDTNPAAIVAAGDVALACALARDPAKLGALRARVADAWSRARLFDTPCFARHLGQAYVKMHERAMRGEKPRTFKVAP